MVSRFHRWVPLAVVVPWRRRTPIPAGSVRDPVRVTGAAGRRRSAGWADVTGGPGSGGPWVGALRGGGSVRTGGRRPWPRCRAGLRSGPGPRGRPAVRGASAVRRRPGRLRRAVRVGGVRAGGVRRRGAAPRLVSQSRPPAGAATRARPIRAPGRGAAPAGRWRRSGHDRPFPPPAGRPGPHRPFPGPSAMLALREVLRNHFDDSGCGALRYPFRPADICRRHAKRMGRGPPVGVRPAGPLGGLSRRWAVHRWPGGRWAGGTRSGAAGGRPAPRTARQTARQGGCRISRQADRRRNDRS